MYNFPWNNQSQRRQFTFIKVHGWTIGFHLKRDFSPENIPFKIGKFGYLILL
jgi:hypothetical protein